MNEKILVAKKKNKKKGFTLIELLAVIVILAIVLVVTIPSVINSMANAKSSQLANAADTVADWLTKEYQLVNLGVDLNSVDPSYTAFINKMGDYKEYYKGALYADKNLNTCGNTIDYCKNESINMLMAAGISNPEENIDLENSYVWINENKIGVKLSANNEGSFYVSDSDNSVYTNNSANDSQFYDGNIFDMNTFTKYMAYDNGESAWVSDFYALQVVYRASNCGFLSSTADCSDKTGTFVGDIYNFKENTSYKVTLNGKVEASSFYIQVKYIGETNPVNLIQLDSTSYVERTANTDDTKTIEYMSVTYGSTRNLYIKNMRIEENK